MKVKSRYTITPEAVKKILVRATNWVGDTVMMIPALDVIDKTFSHAEITVLASPWVISLLEHHPAVDRAMIINKGKGLLGTGKELARIVAWMRAERFDLAVLLQNAFEAAFLASLGKARYRVGYDTDGRGFLLTHRVNRNQGMVSVHQVEYFLGLVESMGWQAEERRPILYLDNRDIESASLLLGSLGIDENHFVVGLNPGAAYGSAKRWPEKRFALVGDWATERWGAKVLLFGAHSESDITDRVARSMQSNPADLCGRTTLGQAMALIKRCNLVVSNDSGLMHVAAAFNIPLVALFGPTNPYETGPLSTNATIVRHAVECSPCLKEECPRNHECMVSIQPEEVWEAMERLKREITG